MVTDEDDVNFNDQIPSIQRDVSMGALTSARKRTSLPEGELQVV